MTLIVARVYYLRFLNVRNSFGGHWSCPPPVKNRGLQKECLPRYGKWHSFMYYPLYTYNNEYRYSAYLDFCIRTYCKQNSGKISKESFIKQMLQEWFEKKNIQNIWKRWAVKCEYFRGISDDGVLYISKKTELVIINVLKSVAKQIHTISQFKIFVTALQAGKPNDYGNRSRTLATIGKQTGTAYKQTVSQRIKKAKNLWLEVEHRFIKVWDKTAQIANSYSFKAISYIVNRFSPHSICKSQMAKVKKTRENIQKINIVKRWAMVNSDFYENYNFFMSNAFLYA